MHVEVLQNTTDGCFCQNGTCQLVIGHADANMNGAREEPKVEPSIDEPEDDKVWKNIISLPILIICM